jgi:hypothetical protein
VSSTGIISLSSSASFIGLKYDLLGPGAFDPNISAPKCLYLFANPMVLLS